MHPLTLRTYDQYTRLCTVAVVGLTLTFEHLPPAAKPWALGAASMLALVNLALYFRLHWQRGGAESADL
jgi:hypothetical protein